MAARARAGLPASNGMAVRGVTRCGRTATEQLPSAALCLLASTLGADATGAFLREQTVHLVMPDGSS